MKHYSWLQRLPWFLLLIGLLLFSEHMHTFIGYPMRVATAVLVSDALKLIGAEPLSVNTILIFENGVTQVDVPCSGVKSLWTGLLFLVAVACIEGHPLNLRWLLSTLAFGILMFSANLTRVGLLVLVGQIAGWHELAEMLHVPLGILGFAASCGMALYLQRGSSRSQSERTELGSQPKDRTGKDRRFTRAVRPAWQAPAWQSPALAGVLLLAIWVATHGPARQAQAVRPPDWNFPANLAMQPLPFTAGELEGLLQGDPESVDRQRFTYYASSGQAIRGTMILITSRTWRAHHRPENCYRVFGYNVTGSSTHLVSPAFPLRFLTLAHDSPSGSAPTQPPQSAAYWFQSSLQTTEDYSERVWAEMLHSTQNDRWVLVSILFDDFYQADQPEMLAFLAVLHDSVQHNLQEGGYP